jgi:hypothetical protein
MTEQEAKTKWCPQATSGDYRPDPDNVGKEIRHPLCIGSACMAWREKMRSETIKGDTRAEDHIAHHVEGFCGLAGKP